MKTAWSSGMLRAMVGARAGAGGIADIASVLLHWKLDARQVRELYARSQGEAPSAALLVACEDPFGGESRCSQLRSLGRCFLFDCEWIFIAGDMLGQWFSVSEQCPAVGTKPRSYY